MNAITVTVPLSLGSVTLRAWGAHQTEALTLDLLTVSATLGELQAGEYPDATPEMVEVHVWEAFFRLVRLSLDGTTLPRTTFSERIRLLEALWQLNDVENTVGKLRGLGLKAQTAMSQKLSRISQARQTTRSMNSSSGILG